MDRRHVLQLAMLSSLASLAPPEHKSHIVANLLPTSAPRTLDEWFIAWADHLHAIRTRPPSEARDQILIDLVAVQQQIRTPGNGDVRELHRVHAALGTLLANSLTRLGEHGPALRWWRSARQAADLCGDPDVRMLVRGAEAGFGLYGQRSPETVLHLTRSARRIKGAQDAALAQVVSAEAKALSLMGRHDEAKQRLRELDGFSLSDSMDEPIPTYYKSDQINFTQSWVYAAAGDETRTDTAGNRVLATTGDYQYVANVQLHQALCTVVNGGVDTGLKEATALLDSLSEAPHSQMITEVGKKILRAVPLDQRRRGTVKDFQAVLAATAPAPPSRAQER